MPTGAALPNALCPSGPSPRAATSATWSSTPPTATYSTGFSPCDIDYFEDFEVDEGEFIESPSPGRWEWGTPTFGAPSAGHGNVWGINLDGYYEGCDDDLLTSPEFDIDTCGGDTFVLEVDLWYHYEGTAGDWDGVTVEFWNGSSWYQVDPESGWDTSSINADDYCGEAVPYIHGLSGFTGDGSEWQTVTFILTESTYPADFKFRFVHGSDGYVSNYAGAYIDNVSLVKI